MPDGRMGTREGTAQGDSDSSLPAAAGRMATPQIEFLSSLLAFRAHGIAVSSVSAGSPIPSPVIGSLDGGGGGSRQSWRDLSHMDAQPATCRSSRTTGTNQLESVPMTTAGRCDPPPRPRRTRGISPHRVSACARLTQGRAAPGRRRGSMSAVTLLRCVDQPYLRGLRVGPGMATVCQEVDTSSLLRELATSLRSAVINFGSQSSNHGARVDTDALRGGG